jgi:hypothetical protein
MDAEEVGDLLDGISVEDALDGEEAPPLQFGRGARGSHAIQCTDPEDRVALLS